MNINIEDVRAFLNEVDSFASERVASETKCPEFPIDEKTLHTLSEEAAQLGLIPLPDSDEEFGLWQGMGDLASMTFNIKLLKSVAEANAGVAFAWHRHALASKLLKDSNQKLEINNIYDVAIVTTGHYGLAQSYLGNYLNSQATPECASFLQDWLDREHHDTVITTSSSWRFLICPVWIKEDICWSVIPREKLQVQACAPQHGFDELSTFKFKSLDTIDSYLEFDSNEEDGCKHNFEHLLKSDLIGILAIATGALKRSRRLAFEYTSIRKQGGKVINKHHAVQQMLGEIDIAVRQAEMSLSILTRSIDDISLSEVLEIRAAMHPLLSHAANQCVQAQGGIGYMRDVGTEKIVRDQNMLRMIAGGIREIPLVLAGLRGEMV